MHCRSLLAADITDSKHYSLVQKAASVAASFNVVDKLLYKNTFKTKRAKRGAKQEVKSHSYNTFRFNSEQPKSIAVF